MRLNFAQYCCIADIGYGTVSDLARRLWIAEKKKPGTLARPGPNNMKRKVYKKALIWSFRPHLNEIRPRLRAVSCAPPYEGSW